MVVLLASKADKDDDDYDDDDDQVQVIAGRFVFLPHPQILARRLRVSIVFNVSFLFRVNSKTSFELLSVCLSVLFCLRRRRLSGECS